MPYSELTYVEIDLAAILYNLKAIKGLLASMHSRPPGILAVVKSNAYGHGILEVAKTILPYVWGLAVFDINEAVTLRQHGFVCPIVLISGIHKEDAKAVCEYSLTPGICDTVSLNALENACKAHGTTCNVHLKVDTGMSRMGFTPQEVSAVFHQASKWPHLSITGVFSHLCCADEPQNPMNALQIQVFEKVKKEVLHANPNGLLFHLANSAAMLHLPQTHYDLVRPGLAIYGGYTDETAPSTINTSGSEGVSPPSSFHPHETTQPSISTDETAWGAQTTGSAQGHLWSEAAPKTTIVGCRRQIHLQEGGYLPHATNAPAPTPFLPTILPSPHSTILQPHLRQAMSFKTHVIATKYIRKNSVVSYGATYTAHQDMRIAVLPVGYDDGYFRSMSNRAEVLIKGMRAPVIGRICMKSMMIDVTHIPGEVAGEEVVLLGSQGHDCISWRELAQWSGTIDYELMCAIGAKNIKRFLPPSD